MVRILDRQAGDIIMREMYGQQLKTVDDDEQGTEQIKNNPYKHNSVGQQIANEKKNEQFNNIVIKNREKNKR